MAREQAGSLWRHHDFMALWTGATVSEVGTQVGQLALPLTALGVLHAGSLGVGVLRALETLPYLLIGLPAGVWVEHRRRRPVLVWADVIRIVVLGSAPVAYAMGHLTLAQLYVAAFLVGVASVVFELAYRSYLPRLLGHERLLDGNAKLTLSESVAQVGGPGIAGLLVAVAGAVPAVGVDAASYAASALGVAAVRAEEPPPSPRPAGASTASLVGAGLRYVAGHPLLRWLTACSTLVNTSIAMLDTVLVVYLTRTLHVGAAGIGVVFLVGGSGVVLGALAAPRAVGLLGYGRAAMAAVALVAGAGILAPLAPGDRSGMWLVAASQWLMLLGASVYSIIGVTLRQAVCPDSLQSRMNATVRFLTWGLIPVGNVVGGVIGSVAGLRPALWVSVAVAAAALAPLLPRAVRSVQALPEREAEPSEPDTPPDGVRQAAPL